MTGFFLATTTTSLVGQVSAEPCDCGTWSSATYIAGTVASAIFLCGCILAWCQISALQAKQAKLNAVSVASPTAKDVACTTDLQKTQPPTTPSSLSVKHSVKVSSHSDSQNISVCAPAEPSSIRAPVEPHPWQLPRSGQGASEGRTPSKRSSVEETRLQEDPYTEDVDACGGWVGSASWAESRTSRKKRVKVGLFARPPSSWHNVDEKIPQPPSPCTPPPTLDVEVPPMPPPTLNVSQMDVEDADTLNQTNAKVHAELQSTAKQDVALRKKLFKSLCAKWHPDKNSSRGVLATEVFQYLQAQKEWYLLE